METMADSFFSTVEKSCLTGDSMLCCSLLPRPQCLRWPFPSHREDSYPALSDFQGLGFREEFTFKQVLVAMHLVPYSFPVSCLGELGCSLML